MAGRNRVDFLRVLIAAAWADGELTCEELNSLKAYFRELGLDRDELTALEPYLADPIGEREAQTIVEDYLGAARGGERETLLAAVRDSLLVDGSLGAGEGEFLAMLEGAREQATTAQVFVAQLKRLWGNADTARSELRRSDLVHEFIRNRVLYQVKRRLLIATGGAELDADTERELRYVCTVAALLGHVAGADRVFDANERATIAEILDSIGAFQPRDVDVIVDIVESEVLSDIESSSFTRELDELASRDDKLQIVGLLFDVAAADGEISHEEHEEIRKISMAMGLSHGDFIGAKQGARPTRSA